jgi:hypothetical protein
MNELEQIAGNEGSQSQERVAQIYIGKKDGREFYQFVNLCCDGDIGRVMYFDKMGFPFEINTVLLAWAIAKDIRNFHEGKYEIKNGYYVTKTKKIVRVEEMPSEKESGLIKSIQMGLARLTGEKK